MIWGDALTGFLFIPALSREIYLNLLEYTFEKTLIAHKLENRRDNQVNLVPHDGLLEFQPDGI